ncbi:hypothetical protein [Actinomyces sp. zg296]|uniref:hypothetical protein n=1 Tax=Actinomyces sp. zg296 TaxID=2609289 RepID=UPI0013589AF4|nr:hypothetical protein [Actinomyces sp. zg296]
MGIMSDVDAVHPYFAAKAAEWMSRAGGDPADSGDLARWAQIVWHAAHDELGACIYNSFIYRGVIIAQDGTLLAETFRSEEGADYVYRADLRRLGCGASANVVGLARGAIHQAVGQPVAYCRYSEVCEGPTPQRSLP